MGQGEVFIVGGPKLLEGQRPILAPAEEKPPMVVVAVQGAPSLTSSSLLLDGAGEGSCSSGFAIGLGTTITGTAGGVGAGHGSSPNGNGKLLSSNVTS